PARALSEVADRFPEVLRIDRVGQAQPQLDIAVQTVGASSWWNANYLGNSSTKIAILDTGIDGTHPALSGQIAASAIYHSTAVASLGASYNDNSSSTDDLNGH